MIRFGTDGWRAIIGEDFNPENVSAVTEAFAAFLARRGKSGGTVFLGFDRRRLSRESASQAAETLVSHGFTVRLSSSYCPTPCIAWNTQSAKAAAGMMITASHNPPQWNGIKFKEEDGGAASPEYTAEIETILRQKKIKEREGVCGRLSPFDPHQDYLAAMRKSVPLKEIRQHNWKIGFDPLYGAGAGFLGRALETDLAEIRNEDDPAFGGLNPEPIEKNLAGLIALVREKQLDAGFATDGDADRIGAVDENGRFVDSHHLFALMLRHLVTVRGERGDVIKTVSTTNMIDRLAAKYHLGLHETPIGFKHICRKFREVNAIAGGEESGGIAVGRWLKERDGIFSALLTLEAMSHHQKRLGELVSDLHREIGPHFFAREDLSLDPSKAPRLRETLQKRADRIAGKAVLRINDLDGRKFLLEDDSWLLIRPSGTEPVLRIYAEAPTPDEVKALLKAGKDLL